MIWRLFFKYALVSLFFPITLFALNHKLLDENPEIYQDILIRNKVVYKGIRSCSDRYESIIPILNSLPSNPKVLDIGASQGYFSFRIAEEYNARCTMIEDSYTSTNQVWHTGAILQYLCEQNSHLKGLSLLKTRVYTSQLEELAQKEKFDLVIAFSVVHHMVENHEDQYGEYCNVIDAMLNLASVALIENPINTGEHTQFIRRYLQEKGGKVLHQFMRGTLIYEIYLFDMRETFPKTSSEGNLSDYTFTKFNGVYRS